MKLDTRRFKRLLKGLSVEKVTGFSGLAVLSAISFLTFVPTHNHQLATNIALFLSGMGLNTLATLLERQYSELLDHPTQEEQSKLTHLAKTLSESIAKDPEVRREIGAFLDSTDAMNIAMQVVKGEPAIHGWLLYQIHIDLSYYIEDFRQLHAVVSDIRQLVSQLVTESGGDNRFERLQSQMYLHRELEVARNALDDVEREVQNFTVLTVPSGLVLQMERKRQDVERLENLLEGVTPTFGVSSLPRRQPFFGRNEEVARLGKTLNTNYQVWGAVITGMGGIGKTALAVEAAYICQERRVFDFFIFVSAKRVRFGANGLTHISNASVTLDGMFSEIARAIDEQRIAQMGGADKQRALLHALENLSSPNLRILLILDNIEALLGDQQESNRQILLNVNEFCYQLPQYCKAILTSRFVTGEGAVQLRLDKLSPDAAKLLINSRLDHFPDPESYRKAINQANIDQLYDATGGSPLLLRWVLGLMQMKQLSFRQTLQLLAAGSPTEKRLHDFLFYEAIRSMHEYDWQVLVAMTLFPETSSCLAVQHVTALRLESVELALERLYQYSLVNYHQTSDTYSMHPITRRLAANQFDGMPEERRIGFSSKFIEYWTSYAKEYGRGGRFEDISLNHKELESELPNLEATGMYLRARIGTLRRLGKRSDADLLIGLSSNLRTFLWFRGYWDERLMFAEWAYDAAKVLGDKWSTAWRAYEAARVCAARNDDNCATKWIRRAREAVQGISKTSWSGDLRLLALIAEYDDRLDEAQAFLEQALAGNRSSDRQFVDARILVDLGNVARKRKQLRQAMSYYERALELFGMGGVSVEQPIVLNKLGNLALEVGDLDLAEKCFEEELSFARNIGREHSFASAKMGLARFYDRIGRYDIALKNAQESLEIFERLSHKDYEEVLVLVSRLRLRTEMATS